MKPEYKKITIWAEHCPVCKEELLGNNSVISPWRCKCGIWRSRYPYAPDEFDIEESKKHCDRETGAEIKHCPECGKE